MGRMWVVVGLAVALLAACGDDEVHDVTDATTCSRETCNCNGQEIDPCCDPYCSAAPLDVDVVQDPFGSLQVYVREIYRPCICNAADWPSFVGQCSGSSDAGSCMCYPAPGSCLSSVRVERDGTIVREAELEPAFGGTVWTWGVVQLAVEDLYDTVGNELVLEGCGGIARVALPGDPFPAPVITEITHDPWVARVHWTSEVADPDSFAGFGTGFGGETCHGNAPGVGEVTIPDSRSRVSVSVFTADGGVAQATELGTVRVWRGRGAGRSDVWFPRLRDDGQWSLVEYPAREEIFASLQLTIDGETTNRQLLMEEAWVDLASGDPLVGIDGVASQVESPTYLRYTAGATSDWLRLSEGLSWRYSGEFPHVAPTVFVLGRPDGATVELDIGPVTLLNEDDSGDTIEVAFSSTWDMGIVSRPEVE